MDSTLSIMFLTHTTTGNDCILLDREHNPLFKKYTFTIQFGDQFLLNRCVMIGGDCASEVVDSALRETFPYWRNRSDCGEICTKITNIILSYIESIKP